MPNKMRLKFTFSALVIMSGVLALAACVPSAVKREPAAPPVAQSLKPDGHIIPPLKVKDSVQNNAQIPLIINNKKPTLPSFKRISAPLYSITAVDVPVSELIYQISKEAGKQLDLYSGIEGRITINALNQPLNKILERITNQAGLIFKIAGETVQIRPDILEWRSYKVDYLNIVKKSVDSIDMQMRIGSSSGGEASGSSTKVSVESEHDFWKKLDVNIKQLTQADPYALPSHPVVNSGKGGNKGKALSSVTSRVFQTTVINPEVGLISVYATYKKHLMIEKYIKEVTHRALQQVLIEATVIEVVLNDKYQAGIDWSNFGNLKFTAEGGLVALTTEPLNILEQLKFLQTFGDSKILSSPKIMAINNQTALLKVVNNLVYFSIDADTTASTTAATTKTATTYTTEIHTVPVGFTMSVTPFVGEDGNITLNVRPTISRKIGEVLDPNPILKDAGVESIIPVIQEKEMSSVLRLKDKQTAVIGGLIEDLNDNARKGLPWLSAIPMVRDIFSQRGDTTTKSELVIFIRPTIIRNPDIDNGDLQSLGRFLRTR